VCRATAEEIRAAVTAYMAGVTAAAAAAGK
jgi:hypothetical protein